MAYLYPTPERQPYPVPTPIEHEPQVIDSKTLMDASVQDEMLTQERQRQQAEQQKAESEFTQMAREAALNAIQRQMAGNIVAQKMNYRDALANGDVAAMDYANKLADAQRAQGNAIGWDGAGYGSDVPLEQAAQNLANNDARALANIFYNQQDSDDHYTMEIANLLDKGYSIDSAKRMAAQSADRLDRKNNAELVDAFATYGLDPRGVLTNNGVRILGSLAQNGNSDLANFYANMYAKPINEYNFNNEVMKAADADRYARGRQVLAGEIQDMLANNQHARQEETLNNNVGRAIKQAEAMIGVQSMGAEAAAATRAKIIKPYVDGGIITPEMGASYVSTGYLVPKETKTTTEKQPSRTTIGVYNQLADLLETAQNDIRTGKIYEMEDDTGSVEAYRLAVEDAIAKGHLTGKDATKARDYAFMLQYMLAMNAATPDTEWASQAYDNMSPDFKKENADLFNNNAPKQEAGEPQKPGFSWEKREKSDKGGRSGKF